jgi:tRNA(fMet)-specific endonuclease VapC
MYLLDTDTLIYFLKGNASVLAHFKANRNLPKAFSVVTYGELIYGCHKSQRMNENLAKVRHLAEIYPVIEVTRPVMECFGELKASLGSAGTSVDDFDLLIGCTALTMNYSMVTNNVKHYQKIPGLKVVNWA